MDINLRQNEKEVRPTIFFVLFDKGNAQAINCIKELRHIQMLLESYNLFRLTTNIVMSERDL